MKTHLLVDCITGMLIVETWRGERERERERMNVCVYICGNLYLYVVIICGII